MESGVCGEDEKPPGLVPPADDVLARDGLHDGVEAALGRVQVTRHLGPFHLLQNHKIRKWKIHK